MKPEIALTPLKPFSLVDEKRYVITESQVLQIVEFIVSLKEFAPTDTKRLLSILIRQDAEGVGDTK